MFTRPPPIITRFLDLHAVRSTYIGSPNSQPVTRVSSVRPDSQSVHLPFPITLPVAVSSVSGSAHRLAPSHDLHQHYTVPVSDHTRAGQAALVPAQALASNLGSLPAD